MVEIRPVPESDLEAVHRLHDRYVARDESLDAVPEWHRDHPDLFVARTTTASRSATASGSRGPRRRWSSAVSRSRRPTAGAASGRILTAFEDRTSALVRLDAEESPPESPNPEYEIAEETVEGGAKKLYVAADGFDPAFLPDVRDAFADPEARRVVEKRLDSTE